ncbi:hypothetical protein HDU86_005803 [Geranomyces michiganensis]|nr:hypothetical protein HDU86_005803 [Geranomyces michiganensis]
MYLTPAAAKSAGAITWNWGSFLQQILNFIIISLAVFFIVKMYTRAFRRNEPARPPETKECPRCTKQIPIRALRCPECCMDLPKEENKEKEDNSLRIEDYDDPSEADKEDKSMKKSLKAQQKAE